jgi:hypothetical protein
MKKETLKELGKSFFAFGNLVGGLSIVNGFFGKSTNVPPLLISIIVIYLVIGTYIAGIKLLNKGSSDD